MAVTLDLETPKRVTINSPGTNALEIIVPVDARYLRIRPEANDAFLYTAGTDGAAPTGDYETYGADASEYRKVPGLQGRARSGGTVSVFLTGTAAARVQVTALYGGA